MRLPAIVSIIFFASCGETPPLASGVPSTSSSDVTAITDATIVTLEGQPLAHQTILIRGSKIESVGDAPVPRGAKKIDAHGLHAMAGLSDMHVHLGLDPEKWMPLFLTCGVTTVMNLHGGPADLTLRERVRAGEAIGPRIFTAGPYANEPTIKSPEDAARLVQAQKRAGYDVIKIHGDLSAEAYERLFAESKEEKIAVVGHLPRKLPFDPKQRAVVHAEEIVYVLPKEAPNLEDAAKRMHDAHVWLIPTAVTQRAITTLWGRPGEIDAMTARLPGGRWLTTDLRLMWHDDDAYGHRDPAKRPRIEQIDEEVRAIVKTFHANGVRITLGTDAPLPGMVPGWSLVEEIDLMTELGFDRADALRAATVEAGEYAADLVPSTDRFGRIAPGHRADIVLLSHDPVASPFTCDDVRGVVAAGRWFGPDDLRRMKTEVAATPSLATRGVELDAPSLVRHVGVYQTKDWKLTIALENGVLVASDPSGRKMRLAPRTSSSFRALDNLSLITVDFSGDKLIFEAEDDERLELVKQKPISSSARP